MTNSTDPIPSHHDYKGRLLAATLRHSGPGRLSILVPYSALILTITMVIYFAARYYLFEGFVMKRYYKTIYSNLSFTNQRGFVNHHVAGMAKVIMLIFAAYPLIAILSGQSTLHSKFLGSSHVTLGDVLVVVNIVFCGMYIFELIYRASLSPIAVCHHVGAIVIAQSAIVVNLDPAHAHDGAIDFVLCLVWGAFDLIAEFWPHVAIVLYRVYPTDHAYLRKVFRFACFTTFFGTIIETITVMYMFGTLWPYWTIAFKVATPILHVVFSAAQLWGARNFRMMWKKQERLLAEAEGSDEEKLVFGGGNPFASGGGDALLVKAEQVHVKSKRADSATEAP